MLGKGPKEVSPFFIWNPVTAGRQALVFGWRCHGCCSGGHSQVRCESSGVREAVLGWLQARAWHHAHGSSVCLEGILLYNVCVKNCTPKNKPGEQICI